MIILEILYVLLVVLFAFFFGFTIVALRELNHFRRELNHFRRKLLEAEI